MSEVAEVRPDVLEGLTSRPRVLARFFAKSRDGWKRKHAEAKAHNKYLQVRMRDLEKSRDHWREVAERQEAEARRLREEMERLQDEAAARQRQAAESDREQKKTSPGP